MQSNGQVFHDVSYTVNVLINSWFGVISEGSVDTLWTTEKIRLVIFRVPHSTPSPRSSIPLAPGPWCEPDSERQDVIQKKPSSHSWHTSFTSLKVDIFRLKHLCRLVAKKKNVWCYSASWKWYLSLDVTGISLIAFDPLDLWDGQVRLVRLRQLADGREWREIMLISLLLQVSSPSI